MKTLTLSLAVLLAIAPGSVAPAQSLERHQPPTVTPLATGLGVLFGTTVGPDGALYVAENDTGRILRIDRRDGQVTTFASGLPTAPGGGGPIDVVFVGQTAYVLVTLVDAFAGGNSINGIYRVDGPQSFTVIADIGQFAADHPPSTPFDLPYGVQFALETYHGGFIVTDGNHNRVYGVTRGGEVSELIAFPDIVPTGMAVRGNAIFMAQAGPVPHLPQDGKVVVFVPGMPAALEIASGAPLLVDVEFGPRYGLFALSQGQFPKGGIPGEPALPNTGSVVVIGPNGILQPILEHLNQPTSLEFIGDTAYISTLAGEIWKIRHL